LKRKFDIADLSGVRKVPLKKRRSLASAKNLAGIPTRAGAGGFFDSLPGYLKANDFKALMTAVIKGRQDGKPVIVMAGGHVIKVGLNPVLIDLMKKGLISGLCLNGAGLIHDSEMAMIGQTSEDVAAGIADGTFGMAKETSQIYNSVVATASDENIGLGQAAGIVLDRPRQRYRRHSLLAACHRLKLPAMIHIAVDTDIVCQHPEYDPAAAAAASHHDFRLLIQLLSKAENGGVFINIGSAVILPEVFLKAVTVARNLYGKPYKIVTANFDMINHYRPATNVVHRPTMHGGDGYNFVGHHELMIPLFAWGLRALAATKKKTLRNTGKKRR